MCFEPEETEKPETPPRSHPLYEILHRLDSERIWYQLGRTMDDSVTIMVTMVGLRVEIYVSADGTVGMSRFHGNEDVLDGLEFVDQLIAEFKADNDAGERELRCGTPPGKNA